MKITGGGEVVRFDGNVVMNIDKIPRRLPMPRLSLLRRRSPPQKRGRSLKSSNAK